MLARAAALAGAAALPACTGDPEAAAVVCYCAQDAEFARPLFEEFTRRTGVVVSPKYDTEAAKTVGLAQAILAEQKRPRADVFWNNEALLTLRLAERGALAPYVSQMAVPRPAAYRGADGLWTGFAARARVLLVHRDTQPRPATLQDLTDPRWAGRIGIAKPLFGSTASHAACLFAAWGAERARAFFQALRQNGVQILAGNKQVAQGAANGSLAFGLTDTDDAVVELDRGSPVEVVWPDQAADGLGTLLLPNTVALVKDGPHPAAGRQLIDFLLSPETEAALAEGPSAQIPLHPDVPTASRLPMPSELRTLAVDFAAAAQAWDEAAAFLKAEFTL